MALSDTKKDYSDHGMQCTIPILAPDHSEVTVCRSALSRSVSLPPKQRPADTSRVSTARRARVLTRIHAPAACAAAAANGAPTGYLPVHAAALSPRAGAAGGGERERSWDDADPGLPA
jgi:hypothetical protein